MTLSQGVDLALTVALLVLVIAVAVELARLREVAMSLGATLGRLQSEMSRLVDEVAELVDDAGEDVSKFGTLLDAANAVTSSMGSASKLAYTAVASPVVKAKALRAGMTKLVAVFKPESGSRKGGR